MNLLENEEQLAKRKKTRIIMGIIIFFIVLLLIVCGGLIYMISDIQQKMFKLTIDGKAQSGYTSDLVIFEGEKIYISIKEYARLVGYSAFDGDHKLNEKTKCYIRNNYEEASFELNSDKMYKTILKGTDNEYYTLSEPVKMINDKLYVNIDGMKIASNTSITYNQTNNQMNIYTLEYLTTYYANKIKNAAIIGDNVDFSNRKAVLYDRVVIMTADKKYGVYNTKGQEIVGSKYLSIKFLENTQDFIIMSDDKKMGIITADGKTKIAPNYDDIKQIDKDLNLYLVKSNKKQGVINQNGSTIVYLEFDNIGVNAAQYANNPIKNQYLLFGKCIPVQRERKWGLYDNTGKQILPIEYDNLGCTIGTSEKNLLIIPKYECIVVQKDKKYGLIDSSGNTLIPCVLDSIYMETISGQDSYKMTQGEKTIDVIDYLEKYAIKPEENTTNTNTVQESTNTETGNNQVFNSLTN